MMLQWMKVGMLVVMCVALAGGTTATAASLAELMARAERGDVQAQYTLGHGLQQGRGRPAGYRQAVVLFPRRPIRATPMRATNWPATPFPVWARKRTR